MTIETKPATPAGWYADPGNSGGLRWWDGSQWTAHTSVPQPQQTAAATARMGRSPYELPPVATPPHMQYVTSPLAPYVPPRRPMSNRAGWLSLAFGGLSVVILIGRLEAGAGTLVYTTAGLAAIVWGIVGLLRVRARQANVVWAPVVGIVLGAISSILIAVAIVLVATHPTGLAPAGNQGQTQQLPPQQQNVVPPAGSDQIISAERILAGSVANSLEAQYNDNSRTLRPGNAWPSRLETQNSQLVDENGRLVFNQAPGYLITYMLVSKTSFQVSVHSDTTNISVDYDSATDTYDQYCGLSLCNTDSRSTTGSGSGSTS